MITLDVIASSLLYAIGIYGLAFGLLGMVQPKLAARFGAQLAGAAPYLSMAALGLFGFIGGGALITATFGSEPYVAESAGIVLTALVFALIFRLSGLSPAVLYQMISRVRLRFDEGRNRRRRLGSVSSMLMRRRRGETHDEKIQNTIATSGVLAIGVTIVNATLASRLWGVEYQSAEAVFAVICGILVLTTIFAAGALQRFDAWA